MMIVDSLNIDWQNYAYDSHKQNIGVVMDELNDKIDMLQSCLDEFLEAQTNPVVPELVLELALKAGLKAVDPSVARVICETIIENWDKLTRDSHSRIKKLLYFSIVKPDAPSNINADVLMFYRDLNNWFSMPDCLRDGWTYDRQTS